ncbi:uncharacterized protein MYCFIDRAFT_208121 [Pseudocercospora fijiensis CIRAD86]|uniref:Uncharacterized protein n=1 Tax=Pseudocercospora fijiensis (strain CIRAD86) TaxID=383855 RepID=M3AD23_PSEFD|nr:uncharacterized protein MYCFIDRAFT_208121 [Pseudocercospora fijiensis CIRAD86]EME82451.1 hypothetical protein MYCFIDRAFT_208121 [Pseudocercospora fijiensis CIRAD86]
MLAGQYNAVAGALAKSGVGSCQTCVQIPPSHHLPTYYCEPTIGQADNHRPQSELERVVSAIALADPAYRCRCRECEYRSSLLSCNLFQKHPPTLHHIPASKQFHTFHTHPTLIQASTTPSPSSPTSSTMSDAGSNQEYQPEKEKPKRKSTKGRSLVRWNPSTDHVAADEDQLALLCVEYIVTTQGVPLDWNEVAKVHSDNTSGEAIKQHLSKLRKAREEADLLVPPPIDRKSTAARKARGRKRKAETIPEEYDGVDDAPTAAKPKSTSVNKSGSLLYNKPSKRSINFKAKKAAAAAAAKKEKDVKNEPKSESDATEEVPVPAKKPKGKKNRSAGLTDLPPVSSAQSSFDSSAVSSAPSYYSFAASDQTTGITVPQQKVETSEPEPAIMEQQNFAYAPLGDPFLGAELPTSMPYDYSMAGEAFLPSFSGLATTHTNDLRLFTGSYESGEYSGAYFGGGVPEAPRLDWLGDSFPSGEQGEFVLWEAFWHDSIGDKKWPFWAGIYCAREFLFRGDGSYVTCCAFTFTHFCSFASKWRWLLYNSLYVHVYPFLFPRFDTRGNSTHISSFFGADDSPPIKQGFLALRAFCKELVPSKVGRDSLWVDSGLSTSMRFSAFLRVDSDKTEVSQPPVCIASSSCFPHLLGLDSDKKGFLSCLYLLRAPHGLEKKLQRWRLGFFTVQLPKIEGCKASRSFREAETCPIFCDSQNDFHKLRVLRVILRVTYGSAYVVQHRRYCRVPKFEKVVLLAELYRLRSVVLARPQLGVVNHLRERLSRQESLRASSGYSRRCFGEVDFSGKSGIVVKSLVLVHFALCIAELFSIYASNHVSRKPSRKLLFICLLSPPVPPARHLYRGLYLEKAIQLTETCPNLLGFQRAFELQLQSIRVFDYVSK